MDAAVLEWPPFRQTPTATETGKKMGIHFYWWMLIKCNQVEMTGHLTHVSSTHCLIISSKQKFLMTTFTGVCAPILVLVPLFFSFFFSHNWLKQKAETSK